jgi:hypothetical protein
VIIVDTASATSPSTPETASTSRAPNCCELPLDPSSCRSPSSWRRHCSSSLVERHLGPRAEAAFLRAQSAAGITVDRLLGSDLSRIAELIEVYADLSLGAVDVSAIAMADRLGTTTIATIDRRHCTVAGPAHTVHVDLLP